MNPFAAVEPIGAARGPLATLQALADALAGPAPQPVAGDTVQGLDAGPLNGPTGGLTHGLTSGLANGLSYGPADAMNSAASNALKNEAALAGLPLSAAIPAAVTAAQAMQGRITLGQLAAEPTALRMATEMPLGATAAEAARGAPISTLAPDSGATARAPITLAVPVLLTPTFATPGQAARAHEGPDSPAARQRDADRQQRPPEPDDDCADEPRQDAMAAPDGGASDKRNAAAESDDGAESAGAHDPEALALRALLQRAEQLEALRELALGRRVLLVLPQAGGGHGAAPAAAALLTSEKVQHFGARWWPGSAHAVHPGWLRWRVFRSGEPQLDSGLRSRCASTACHLRLGPHAAHLMDAGTAQVELAERIRFTQALGAQWSLLVVAAPPGACA